MHLECLICHELVRVPVRFLCWPCVSKQGQPKCNSMTRVCITCARHYLELNQPRDERTPQRKCLTCPAIVRLSRLCAKNAYEKDYLLMSMDSRTDIPCPREDEGCFFTGNQNELDRHLQSHCAFRTKWCQYCTTLYKANVNHASQCRGHTMCTMCTSYVPSIKLVEHKQEVHGIWTCYECKASVSVENRNQHCREECPERFVSCEICHMGIKAKKYNTHCLQHVVTMSQEIQVASQLLRTRTEQLEKLVKIVGPVEVCGNEETKG